MLVAFDSSRVLCVCLLWTSCRQYFSRANALQEIAIIMTEDLRAMLRCAALQERPEDVPTGELPRSVQLVADRHLVGRVAPGTRVTVYGIYSIYQVLFARACTLDCTQV